MTTYPPERFVEVVWSDAYADKATKAFSVDEIKHTDEDNLPVVTRGFLLREDDKGVSVAPEFYLNTEDNKWNYRGRTFILKSMILSVTDYPPKKKKSRLPKTHRVPELVEHHE